MSPISLLRRTAATGSLRPYAFRAGLTSPQLRCRPLSRSAVQCFPEKGVKDRESMNTESNEHTKSSTDADVAQQDEAAYNPNLTSPESEMDEAGKGQSKNGNPLDVSGANKDVSKQHNPDGGAENAPEDGKRSGHGSPTKNG